MRRKVVLIVAVISLLALSQPALAHPLGNYTTNVHLGITVTPGAFEATLVVDMAEIPAFREPIQDPGYAETTCLAAGDDLVVSVDDAPRALALEATQLTMPPGEAGLATLRLTCIFSGTAGPGIIAVDNQVYADRIGWAEIVVSGGVSEAPAESPSEILTNYPDGPVLNQRSVTIQPSASGTPTLSHLDEGAAAGDGILSWLSGLAGSSMGPVSLMAAMGLGIAHALAPGHGKTLMAAYLVSRGGKARHAAVLGLSVAVSHTLGVAVLGVATLVAANTFRPERVYPWLSGVSAIVITVIGVTMLGRVMTGSGRHQPGVDHDQGDHDHDHGHSHDHDHDHGHSHQPQVTGWRSMVGLGLAGGLVPSASAVILLLAGIGSGRPALGLVMVLFFGLGMSLALVGAGLAVVGLYRWGVGRFRGEGSRRIRRLTPALAAFAVTGVGLFLLMDVIRAV